MATPGLPNKNPAGSEIARESGALAAFDLPLSGRTVPLSIDYDAIRECSEVLAESSGDALGVILGTGGEQPPVVRRFEFLRNAPGTPARDPQRIREAVRQLVEALGKQPGDMRPIGLFRTQQGGWAAVNDFDSKLIGRCVNYLEPHGKLFVVIRNFSHRPRTASIFPLDDGLPTVQTQPALELPFDDYLLRKGYLSATPEPVPAIPEPIAAHQRRSGLLVAGLVLLGFLVGAGVWRMTQSGKPNRADIDVPDILPAGRNLGLKVARNGGDMDIAWNRYADGFRDTSGGTLTIRDGPMVRVVALSPAQLREGHIWFSPLAAGDLDLRLEITHPDGRSDAESLQVLGWENAPRVAPPNQPPAGISADRWKSPAVASDRPARKELPVAPAPETAAQAPPAAEPPPPARKTLPPVQTAAGSEAPAGPPPALPQPPTQSAAATQATPNPLEQFSSPAPPVAAPLEKAAQAPPAAQPKALPSQPKAPAQTPIPAPRTSFAGPEIAHRVKPVLTQEARAELRRSPNKVAVTVRIDIDENGAVRSADVAGMTGEPANGGMYVKLTALSAARQWRFRPASVNGKNVRSQMSVVFEF